jgi:hypothetical protein
MARHTGFQAAQKFSSTNAEKIDFHHKIIEAGAVKTIPELSSQLALSMGESHVRASHLTTRAVSLQRFSFLRTRFTVACLLITFRVVVN